MQSKYNPPYVGDELLDYVRQLQEEIVQLRAQRKTLADACLGAIKVLAECGKGMENAGWRHTAERLLEQARSVRFLMKRAGVEEP